MNTQTNPTVPLTVEDVRKAGGIVHGDGNIFFSNIEQLNAAILAAAEPVRQKPLFADLIAQHPGLAEELKAMDAHAVQDALEDCKSHRQAWRDSILVAQSVSKEEGDVSYWSHELAAFDRTFNALITSPAAPVQEPDKHLQLALEALAPLEKLFREADEQGLLTGANVDCQIATIALRKSAYAASDIRARLNALQAVQPENANKPTEGAAPL
jgi:hypothetical protein